ncbi:MAG: DEAD/DEAH box helicase, partial [Candidatus Heimdallarchaeota archaeon]|nr:DEAD/DEAH box helicase [Candidatus Heimdallarchaeota archaeon]
MLFTEMDIHPQIVQALEETQIVSPTEIQEQCIPHGLSLRKSHIVGQAKTGSGKTLAFAIPIIQQINVANRHIQAVVLVPTRELCKQNAAVFRSITKHKRVKIVEVYGGASIRVQIDQIRDGGQVIVATPGRLIDLVHQRKINFKAVNFVALDEADRMLDMGFLPDMEFLLLEAMKHIKPRLFLFSATMMGEIKQLIYRFTQKDIVHEIDVSKDSLTVENCDQYAFHLEKNKFWSLVKILNTEQPKFSIIFTKTKRKAQELCRRLKAERNFTFDFKVGFIHGDLTQAKREEPIRMFRARQLNCIVGTNVLARGLDFPQVSHVFQYDLPRDPEDYVHRIG